jgi:hypothetical protein
MIATIAKLKYLGRLTTHRLVLAAPGLIHRSGEVWFHPGYG